MALNPRIEDWQGKRVWIVGASTGIGAALARELIARGARVAGSARSADKLAEVLGAGGAALALPADVTQPDALAAAHGRIVAAWGGVDVLVYMAGTYKGVRAWKLRPGMARAEFETNVLGAFDAVAVALPAMLERGAGTVVIVSSVAGYRGLPMSLIYSATKAALINMAETLYLDLAAKGIGVHVVNPGFVETPLTAQNKFRMPALIKADEAAREILAGLARGEFETHFPKRFTRWLKLMRHLPHGLYFRAIHRFTGL
ncbi:MAG: SDR family NAD(P)-dependent oxidoreductase [Burkholderiales bacterium]|nr:SDR family NAD(P)-dependent oxidoreductase [Burkholderiales bacterium]